jgi:hypothetical protein
MPIITGKPYDVLKFIAQILLPSLGTLYFALAGIWGLPAAEQVVGTIVALDTFLGVMLGISSNAYSKSDAKFDGVIGVTETADKLSYVLNLNEDPVALKDKSEVRLKVGPSVSGTLAA